MDKFPEDELTSDEGSKRKRETEISVANISSLDFIPSSVDPFHFSKVYLIFIKQLTKHLLAKVDSAASFLPKTASDATDKRKLIKKNVGELQDSLIAEIGMLAVCDN